MPRLKHNFVLITGGNSGIGLGWKLPQSAIFLSSDESRVVVGTERLLNAWVGTP